MNKEMYDRALEAIRDPSFGDAVIAEILAKRAALVAFEESEVFTAMVAALTSNPMSVSIDSETAAYFPEQVREEAGWPDASIDDIRAFFSVLGNSSGASVDDGSHSEDDDCSFDNESFRNHGLTVFRMSGQGTFIRISNG